MSYQAKSVICHLSFVICHLSFVIRRLSFVIRRLSFVIREQKRAYAARFTFYVLRFAPHLLLLLAFALRLHALEAQSIWWDEGISLNLARSTLPQILADRLHNIHPPLYFLILKGWVSLTGLHAFGGRYLSALASLLQVAAVYAVCRRWFSPRYSLSVIRKPCSAHRSPPPAHGSPLTPLIAMLLVTFSPLSIIYGQETRVYAMLPLVYLALLALAWEIVKGQRTKDKGQRTISARYWPALALVEWIGLHLHYVMAFVVFYVGVWLLWVLARTGRWADLRRLMATQIVVCLAALPWLTAVLRNWAAVQAEANAGTYLSEPAPLDFLLKQVWIFHHTGLAGALARPGLWAVALLVLALTVVLFLLRLTPRRRWTRDKGQGTRDKGQGIITHHLLLQWLLPLSGALIVWTVRSFSHPRYIAFAAIGFIPLAAYLIAPGAPANQRAVRVLERAAGAVLFTALLALSLSGLSLYFYDPQVAKDDMRGAARYLQETLTAEDRILVPDAGWAFHFEYGGQTPIVMPGLQQPGLWQRLGAWTEPAAQGPHRIALLSAAAATRDWQGVIPFALEQAGSLLQTRQFDGLVVRIYEINRPAARPQPTPLYAAFGALQLTGAWVEQGAAADTAIALALRWQTGAALAERQHVALTLTDSDGLPLARLGDLLVDGDGRPTEQWPAGYTVTTTHLLPIPLGTPPLPMNLRIGIDGVDGDGHKAVEAIDANGVPQGVFITWPQTVTVSPSAQPGANPYDLPPGVPRLPQPVAVRDGLWLTAFGQDRSQAGSGQTVRASLEWLAEAAPPAGVPLRLQLTQAGQVLAESVVGSHYPMAQWRAGEIVLEHHLLRLPANVAAGAAIFTLLAGEQVIPLGQVEVALSDHNFAPPMPQVALDVPFGTVARLAGFDLPQAEVIAGDVVPLTLYWQAMTEGTPVAYTVFVHLLAADGRTPDGRPADGQPIGQHDSPPANGNRPTTGWITDEYIADPHQITFRETAYTGPAYIAVGLYDPATGARLLLADGPDAGASTLLLPVTLMVRAVE